MTLPELYPAQIGSPNTVLTSPYTTGDTEMNVEDASLLSDAPNLVCLEGTSEGEFRYTLKSGNTLQGVTVLPGTPVATWPTGTNVFRGVAAYDHNSIIEHIRHLEGPVIGDGIYGVRIDTTNPNPERSVTYTDESAGFIPMDGNNGNFSWGSWETPFRDLGIKPCVFKDGAVNYYLNPNNYNQKEDGTLSDITTGNDGDVMVEFQKIYWRFSQTGNYRYIQISKVPREGFVCLAHTRGEAEVDTIHIGAYHGCVINGKLRSLSGKTPTVNQTHATFRGYAQANGVGYEQLDFYQMLLTQILYVIFFKSLDGQTALGRGYTNTSAATTTGNTDSKGMFWGSTNAAQQMKFCGIEDWYGNIVDWVDGVWSTANTAPARKLWIATDSYEIVPYVGTSQVDVNPRPENYNEYGTGFSANVDGYIRDIHGTNETGFVTTNNTGSETTGYCDYANLRAGCLGSFGGNWAAIGTAGPFRLALNVAPSIVYAAIGGRLTHKKKVVGDGK